jgi:hypothetical protein
MLVSEFVILEVCELVQCRTFCITSCIVFIRKQTSYSISNCVETRAELAVVVSVG